MGYEDPRIMVDDGTVKYVMAVIMFKGMESSAKLALDFFKMKATPSYCTKRSMNRTRNKGFYCGRSLVMRRMVRRVLTLV